MTDPRPGQPPLRLAAFTPYRIVALARRMSGELGQAYRHEGLSIPEWRVLAVVAQEPVTAARDVARLTPMDKMAVSRAVNALEKKGLIVRERHDDRRVSSLRLTSAGEIVYQRVAALALSYEEQLLGRLSDVERRAFLEGLAALERTDRAAE
jgi:DNA-binding MarR family transcriptional regulator